MRKKILWLIMLVVVIYIGWSLPHPGKPPAGESDVFAADGNSPTLGYLSAVLNCYNSAYYVYADYGAAGNHFNCRARMGSPESVPSMDESCHENPRDGSNCIKCVFNPKDSSPGGWYFMNGVLEDSGTAPKPNWGTYPNAGIDLRGAAKLTFWARGAEGGERVEFFALGVGRDPVSGAPTASYPDSSPGASTGLITLTTDWKQYSIDLSEKDLSYVLGGFGWIASAKENKKNIAFFIDEMKYDKAILDQPRFIISYETTTSSKYFNKIMQNVALSYDNALVLLAFDACGDIKNATLVADAFVYAQNHDRFYNDGRLRNAYMGGDLVLPPGWAPNGKSGTVRLPQWNDPEQLGTYTGNMAWVMTALLTHYEITGGEKYLDAAKRIGEWIQSNCYDTRGAGGYTGGYRGWEPNPHKMLWKSTEHNIDVYAAFQKLYLITKDSRWKQRAEYAKKFVSAMWDDREGKFWIGTKEDGVSINNGIVTLDAQAWTVLALLDSSGTYLRALKYAEKHLAVDGGFDFNEDKDGIWFEGTAQMACAYYATKQADRRKQCIAKIEKNVLKNGAVPAASTEALTTGLYFSDGKPWLYYNCAHTGAAAWLLLAEAGKNPFWIKL